MDTILDITKTFLYYVCFCLLPTDVAWDNIVFLFVSGNCIRIFFGKMAPASAIIGTIYLCLSSMYNALLYASGHSPEDKIEERILFALIHAYLYLAESDDERDDKSVAANTFNISCDGGGYRYSLSAITVSVSATSEVICC